MPPARRGWEQDADSLLDLVTFSSLDCPPLHLAHCCLPGLTLLPSPLLDPLFPVSHLFLFLGYSLVWGEDILQLLSETRCVEGENALKSWVFNNAFIPHSHVEFCVGSNSFRIWKALLLCLHLPELPLSNAKTFTFLIPCLALTCLWKVVRSLCPQCCEIPQWFASSKCAFIHSSRHSVGL